MYDNVTGILYKYVWWAISQGMRKLRNDAMLPRYLLHHLQEGESNSAQGAAGKWDIWGRFPILSSAFASAAAVSQTRCEVDAEAACQAASTLALEYDGMNGSGDDPVLRPFLAVRELISLAVKGGWRSVRKGFINPLNSLWQLSRRAMWRLRRKNNGNRWIPGGEDGASSFDLCHS